MRASLSVGATPRLTARRASQRSTCMEPYVRSRLRLGWTIPIRAPNLPPMRLECRLLLVCSSRVTGPISLRSCFSSAPPQIQNRAACHCRAGKLRDCLCGILLCRAGQQDRQRRLFTHGAQDHPGSHYADGVRRVYRSLFQRAAELDARAGFALIGLGAVLVFREQL